MKEIIAIAQKAERQKSDIEQARNLPADIISECKELGLTTQWVAKALGGPQKDVHVVAQMWQSIAYYNGSLAWVLSVTNCSSLISGFLPTVCAKMLFNDSKTMIGGFAAPVGTALVQDQGLMVSGQWSWGSGITYCDHIVGGVKIMKEGKFAGTGIVFFKPEEITLLDNWHVVGMKGTHSIDYTAKNILIPVNRWIKFPPSQPMIDAPLYRFSFLGALSLSVSSVGLGLAQRAVYEIKKLAKSKKPVGQKKTLSQQAITQEKIGKIEANFLAAQSFFYSTVYAAESQTNLGQCSSEMKAQIRLASCHTTSLCTQIVRDAYQIAGGSAIWQSNKLEELHRDMHVISQHGMASESNYRTAGAVLLGNDVPEMLL